MEDGDIDLAEENARLRAELLAANAQQQQPAAQHLVNAVVKIPPFWPMRPVEWFLQAESVFTTSHITSERTRFHYVLQQLPPETITTALDIIKNQATLPDPYTRLKNKLTHTFGKTKYQMCDELLDMPALGSGKPSLLMSNMLALLPDGDQPGTLFMCMFLRRLPEFMRRQLKAGRYETTEEMARAADDLWEDSAGIHAATQSSGSHRQHSPAAKHSGGNRDQRRYSPAARHSGGNRDQRQRSPSPRRLLKDYPSGNRLCPYHWAFGRLAKSCRPNCAWTSQQGN